MAKSTIKLIMIISIKQKYDQLAKSFGIIKQTKKF